MTHAYTIRSPDSALQEKKYDWKVYKLILLHIDPEFSEVELVTALQ
jgi:hypothetical protein